jgi:predicted transcriptional regulator
MPTATLDPQRTANMTVKLDGAERDRLKALATAKKRTPHYLMREAIQKYLEEEEAEQRFIAAGEASLSHFQQTGLHITLDELRTWAQDVKENPDAPMPACHA